MRSDKYTQAWNEFEDLLADHPGCQDPKAMAATLKKMYEWPSRVTGKYQIENCSEDYTPDPDDHGIAVRQDPKEFTSVKEADKIWSGSPYKGNLSTALSEAVRRHREDGNEEPEKL
jgi:hypothetical protein